MNEEIMKLDIQTCQPSEIPWFPEIVALVRELLSCIDDDDRATDDPDDDEPGMQLTIASDADLSQWGYQTGDNSYSGACYHLPFWGVAYLCRDSVPEDVASELIDEILSQIA